jgi:hypothetical protein
MTAASGLFNRHRDPDRLECRSVRRGGPAAFVAWSLDGALTGSRFGRVSAEPNQPRMRGP